MKLKKNDFIQFIKKEDAVATFLLKYISETTKYDNLGKIFKLLLIPSHGQAAQVECRFSMNSNILVENHHKDSLIAQRRVNDYMGSQTLQPYKLPVTKKLLTNVKIARFRYFQVLGERHHTKNWSEKAEKRAVFDAGIDKINKEIIPEHHNWLEGWSWQKAMIAAAQQTSLAEIKSTISKCNALKWAANEKALELDKVLAKKKVL